MKVAPIDEKIRETWLKCSAHVRWFGDLKVTHRGVESRESLHVKSRNGRPKGILKGVGKKLLKKMFIFGNK